MIDYPKCKTCKHYDPRSYGNIGNCLCKKLNDDGVKTRDSDECIYCYSEGGAMNVGENFGCIHHVEKEK